MIRRIVLLPEPEGPSKATSWPAGTSNETSVTAWNVPISLREIANRDAPRMTPSGVLSWAANQECARDGGRCFESSRCALSG